MLTIRHSCLIISATLRHRRLGAVSKWTAENHRLLHHLQSNKMLIMCTRPVFLLMASMTVLWVKVTDDLKHVTHVDSTLEICSRWRAQNPLGYRSMPSPFGRWSNYTKQHRVDQHRPNLITTKYGASHRLTVQQQVCSQSSFFNTSNNLNPRLKMDLHQNKADILIFDFIWLFRLPADFRLDNWDNCDAIALLSHLLVTIFLFTLLLIFFFHSL